MSETLEERIGKAGEYVASIMSRLRERAPMLDKGNLYPIVSTVPDEPFFQCVHRSSYLGEKVNLIVLRKNKIEVCTFALSHCGEWGEEIMRLPKNTSYAIGQYIDDSLSAGKFYPVRTIGNDDVGAITDLPILTFKIGA